MKAVELTVRQWVRKKQAFELLGQMQVRAGSVSDAQLWKALFLLTGKPVLKPWW